MPRSHPPTLATVSARTIREERLVARGERVLLALSGGPDSMALLHVLAGLRQTLGFALVAHGVDHGLRVGAAAELDVAERFSESLQVPFARSSVQVAAGGNLQARARAARYEALRAWAKGADCAVIATAHHRDDRAETVLLRLLRGAGPRGLAVLPPRANDLVRPFLRASREAIDAHIARHRIPFSTDPSNRDPRFLRVRVRHELLPLLRELSPGIDEHLCALADQLALASLSCPESTVFAPHPLVPPAAPARASLQAIATLVAARSGSARVPLKGGLVARWDRASRSLAIEPAPLRPRSEAHRANRASSGACGNRAPDVPPGQSPIPAIKGTKYK